MAYHTLSSGELYQYSIRFNDEVVDVLIQASRYEIQGTTHPRYVFFREDEQGELVVLDAPVMQVRSVRLVS